MIKAMTPKIIFKNLDYICHKFAELQKNLKHFEFWKYFYWKHDKATLREISNLALWFVPEGAQSAWTLQETHCNSTYIIASY